MSTAEDHSIVSRGVSAHGYRINVQVEGEGEPLLLINGLTRPLDSWAPFAHALRGRQVVSFDAPGVGAVSYTHLDVYKRQDTMGMAPTR